MAGIANTIERRNARHDFVRAHLDKIAELRTFWAQELERKGYEFKPNKYHGVRFWVESIRYEAGYGVDITWRLIWKVLCSDYEKIKKLKEPKKKKQKKRVLRD